MGRLVRLVLLGIVSVVFAVVLTLALGEIDDDAAIEPSRQVAPASQPVSVAEVLHRKDVAPPPVTPHQPSYLRLWKFDAPVIPLAVTGDELVPPSDPHVLGWWGQPAGAEQGVTLVVGHTVHDGGGTFDDLEDTPVGTIADLSGVQYRVTSVEVITKVELAERANDLFDQSGKPRLVLVTCEGYDPSTGHYDSNVVVQAVQI